MAEITQDELNKSMVTLGVGRYRAKIESAKGRDAELETRYGQTLMRGALPLYTTKIGDWQKAVKDYATPARYQTELQLLEPKVIAYIATRAIIDSITKKRPLSQVAIYLGARLEDELRCRFLLENNEQKGSGILLGAKRRKGLNAKVRHVRSSMKKEAEKGLMPEYRKWATRDKASAGLNAVELFRSCTGLIEYNYVLERAGRRPTRFVAPTKELVDWIENYNDNRELIEPFWMPTVDLPEPWTDIWNGGYPKDDRLPTVPFIKSSNMDYLRSIKGGLEESMNAVNHIQQTPWEINSEVKPVLEWAWDNNVAIGDIPNRKDEEFPPMPRDFKTNKESNTNWRRAAAKIYDINLSTKSRRLLTAKVLHLANRFEGNRFFFPSNVDWRGRVYNIPSFLNIQNADPSRGLLRFFRSERVKTEEQARWLAIHGANTYGNDKVTLDERVAWAMDYASEAQLIADNPTKHLSWKDSDSPWQHLAWCFEWATYTREGKVDTKLPCAQDATNNGLQLLACLTQCEETAYATNAAPTPSPQDIYAVIADIVVSKLSEEAATGNVVARKWLAFGVDRKATKRPTMVYPYGGTFYSCRAYIDEWYQDRLRKEHADNPFSEGERFKVTGYLSKFVWQSIQEMFDKPTKCMKYLQGVAKVLTRAGKDVTWTAPSGFPVLQHYTKQTSKSVSTKIAGEATWVNFRDSTDELSVARAKQGISPNFVHSLDASILTRTVATANSLGIWDFACIHDSFGTHSTRSQDLADAIRKSASEIFSVDLLREFDDTLRRSDPELEYPELPEYGTFDPTTVKHSQYLFS
jgi:DNA-directed RNA polymerase